MSVAARGTQEQGRAQEGWARPPIGRLDCFLTCTPSPLDHICSKKSHSRRFHSVWTPFDIPFLRNTEVGKKKQQYGLGLRLVG